MNKRKKQLIAGIIAVVILVGGICGYAFTNHEIAVPEKRQLLDLTLTENEFYFEEENFVEAMETVAEPYNEQYKADGYVENDDISIYYQTYITGTANQAIVISHGFTECTDKYTEVIYYYLQSGYDVYIMDHVGHGNSTRKTEDPSLVHITDFNDYVEGLKLFVDEVVVKNNGENPLYIYAHSMGGGIAVKFLETYTEYFDAAVLSAPMVDINTGSVPEPIAAGLASVMNFFGNETGYVLGYSAYDGAYDFEGSAASSKTRYEYYYQQSVENSNNQLTAASYGWLSTAVATTKEIVKEENLAKIQIPVLLFQADNDTYIDNNGLYKAANGLSDVRFIFVEGSKHQLYSTANELLIPYFNTIFNFLEEVK